MACNITGQNYSYKATCTAGNDDGTCPPPACVDTSWSPDPSTVCSGTSFTQTSNCGDTRSMTGAKSCVCTPSTVTNGTVGSYPSCTITCNSGYTLSGSSCVSCGPTEQCSIVHKYCWVSNIIYGASCNIASGTYTYKASCTAGADDGTCPAPTCTFTTSLIKITPPQKSTLSWSCQHTTSCSIDHGIGSVNAMSGSVQVSPTSTMIYTLSCDNASYQQAVTVNVVSSTIIEIPP